MIDRLPYVYTHPYTYLSSVPSVPSLLLAYLQGTMRYRHSRIHTTDPRRVVVGCSLPPSLPPPCQEKVYKHTYLPGTLPHLSTSTSISPTTATTYVYIHVQYIREGGYNDVYSI